MKRPRSPTPPSHREASAPASRRPLGSDLDIASLFERYASTYATRDTAAIVSLHAPDSQFWLHTGGPPATGREAIAAALEAVFARWPQSGFEAHRILYGPRHWVLDWAITAVLKGSDGSDRPVRFDALDLVEVDEAGLVTRKDTFVDAAQAQAALAAAAG